MSTVLSVLAPDCDPTMELACNSNEGNVPTSALTVTLESGQAIVIVINAFNRAQTEGVAQLHIWRAP
jgi:hypothetical protein